MQDDNQIPYTYRKDSLENEVTTFLEWTIIFLFVHWRIRRMIEGRHYAAGIVLLVSFAC